MARTSSTFTGRATINVDHAMVPRVSVGTVRCAAEFDPDTATATLTSFDPIVRAPVDTPIGPNTTTVSLELDDGGDVGNFDVSSGSVRIAVKLRFDESVSSLLNSELALMLGTDAASSPLGDLSGRPIDALGAMVLVGAGQFEGGFLNGAPATVQLTGAWSPLPPRQ